MPRRSAVLAVTSALLLGLGVSAAGPASADASLTVLGVHDYTDSFGTHHVFGMVRNTSSAPVSALVDLYDDAGTPVGNGDVLLQVVGPGESVPWEAQLDPGVSYSPSAVQATATPPSIAYNHAFTVQPTNEYTDGTGTRHIVGTVRNDNTTTAENVALVFTFLAGDGTVVGGEGTGAGDGSPIAGGATVPFDEAVNPEFPAYATWTALAESTSAPSGNGAAGSPASGGSSSGGTTLNCNPVMTLSTTTVNVGSTTSVSVSGGTPGSKLMLEGYSRPSTTYAPIRTEVTIGADGTVPAFAVRPPTSARVRLSVAGCATAGTGQVISVIPGLGVSVARVGTRTYAFAGKILPSTQNTGRYIGLYVNGVKKLSVRSAADGTYRARLTLPRGATRAWWATGADMTNLAGKSAVRAFTSY